MSSQISPLKLLTLGYSVIPSGGGDKGKTPLVDWQEFQDRLPTDGDLEQWEGQYHPALWGIVTGKISGVVVIDVDRPSEYKIFETQGLKPHVTTPRGGEHYYFRHPGFPIKTMAGLMLGLDIWADGGFVNLVGTNTKTGGDYKINILPTPDAVYKWEVLPEPIKNLMLKDSKGPAPKVQGIIPEGQRDATLTSLAGSMQRRGMSSEGIRAALMQENEARCQPPLTEAAIDKIVKSISRYEPAAVKPPRDNHNKQQPDLKYLDQVEAIKVEYLWYPYIPIGKLTLLEGDPGVGKSWVMLAVSTAVSIGHGLPPSFGENLPGPVLIASAEDGLRDTTKPRLTSMQADESLICAIDGLFTLDDPGFEMLEDWIKQVQPVLVIIDPLVAYLSGEMDINKANQVRYATARLAEKYNIAIVAVRHLTKGASLKPLYRGLGSIDFTAAARSVLLAGNDPDDPETRGIVHIKSNLAPKGVAVGFKITRDTGFNWLDCSTLTADQILSAGESSGSALETAKNFLLAALEGGPQMAKEVYTEADNQGISKATLRRAKDELKIINYPQNKRGKRGANKWFMRLPDGV